jgi:acyl-homoserine lactone acylase PvdQ
VLTRVSFKHCVAASKSRHALLGVFQNKLFRARLASTLSPELVAKIVDAPRNPTKSTILASGFPEGWQASEWTATLDSVKEFKDAINFALSELTGVAGLEPAPGGSNIWNLGAMNTSTGTNLLSGDPHRETECPNMVGKFLTLFFVLVTDRSVL